MSSVMTRDSRSMIRHGALSRYHRTPIAAGSSSWMTVCELNKVQVASIAIALAVIILLLAIFAYHRGMVMVSIGLAVIAFVPILIFKIIMNSSYRRLKQDIREIRRQIVESQTQTIDNRQNQHVFACIILTPQEFSTNSNNFVPPNLFSDIPTYEEATQNTAKCSTVSERRYNISDNRESVTASRDIDEISNRNITDERNEALLLRAPSCTISVDSETVNEESPPPSYDRALSVAAISISRYQQKNPIDGTDEQEEY